MAREGVPVIDLQRIDGLGKELVKACEEWGCFRLLNHGVSQELMSEMKAVTAALFNLPEEIKRRTADTEPSKGYVDLNKSGSFFEGFSIEDISTSDEFLDLLDASPHQREIVHRYIKVVRDLAGDLGRKVMEGVDLDEDLFDEWRCQLRMNKYHYCPESLGLTGFWLHTDYSFLTILQDDESVNGLLVVDGYSGEFAPVDHVPGTLVVNVGDMAKAWSNGRFCNVKHRVQCFEAKTRYTIGLFMLGPNDKKVETSLKFVDSEHPRLYVPINIEEYRRIRTSTGLRSGGALELFTTTKA